MRTQRPFCDGCGGPAAIKERPVVELVDLPAFGRPCRLVWRKHRWLCEPGLPDGIMGGARPGDRLRPPRRNASEPCAWLAR